MYSSETLFPRAPETQASCYLPGKVAVGDWSSLIGLACSGHTEKTHKCVLPAVGTAWVCVPHGMIWSCSFGFLVQDWQLGGCLGRSGSGAVKT